MERSFLHRKRHFLLLFWLLGALLLLLAYQVPGFGSWWAMGPYRAVVSAIAPILSWVPFSLCEIGLYLLLLLLLFFLLYGAVRLIRYPGRRLSRFLRGIYSPFLLLGVLFFLYAAFCGVNYTRTSFAEESGISVRASSTEELYDLCVSLTRDANRLREKLPEQEDGTMATHFANGEERRQEAARAFNKLEETYPTLWSADIAPKLVWGSEGMCYLNITGIYMPLTLEANVNTAVRPDEEAAVMCHELTHLRGYMQEEEANFIAYLACRDSDDPEFQYSGTLLALLHARNALYSADPEAYKAVNSLLDDGVRRDLQARSAFWKQYDTPAADVAQNVNDGYLKLNQQPDGVKSYGRMVDLLLSLAEKENAAP